MGFALLGYALFDCGSRRGGTLCRLKRGCQVRQIEASVAWSCVGRRCSRAANNASFRSFHFIGPSTAVAPLIVLAIAYLPGFLAERAAWREGVRLLLVVVFFLLYPPLPHSFDQFNAKVLPGFETAGRTVKLLQGIWQHAAGPPVIANTFVAQRLGFEPAPTEQCCVTLNWVTLNWNDVEQVIRGVHDATNGRTTFVDNFVGWHSSYFYFLGNLRPTISSTEPVTLLWTERDLLQWQRELRAADVECLVTGDVNAPLSKQVLASFTNYEETMIDAKLKVWIYCRPQ